MYIQIGILNFRIIELTKSYKKHVMFNDYFITRNEINV